MPQENRAPADVLAAIAKTAALADLSSQGLSNQGRGLPDTELQALLEGHERAGQPVAPYLRLLTYEPGEEIVREGEWGGDRFFFVVAGQAEVFVKRGYAKVGELPPGALFGEMSVLANLPRSSTVSAPPQGTVTVLEVQRPAVPLLRKLPLFAAALDKAYRRNSRALFLQDVGVATRLDAESLSKLATIAQFRVFEPGHTLFQEGEPIRRLFLLKSGWIKLSKAGEAAQTELDERDWATAARADYLGAGYCFGLEGVAGDLPWPQTGTLLRRAEVLEISVPLLREMPALIEDISAALKKLAPDAALAYQRQPLPIAAAQAALIRTGVADATNLLAIDARTCIRCGNCAQACHDLHGQARLAWRGFTLTRPVSPAAASAPKSALQPLLVPSACQHCRQPDCLTGCPTNAIKQLPDGRVEIEAAACIGCGDCAALCPYDAIALVPRADETSGQVAVKCDLCVGAACNADAQQPRVHGCEENCPTGALRRVVPGEQFAELHDIEAARMRRAHRQKGEPRPPLIERWHARPAVWRMHLAGGVGTLLLALLAVFVRSSWPSVGFSLGFGTLRGGAWVSGGLGLVALAGAGAYVWRKRARTRRLGPLRYWLLAHNYAGLWALLLFAWHAGRGFHSPLTKLLALALGLVGLTGLLGQVLNTLLPRWLTKHEAQPWRLEDLLARRAALRAEDSADTELLRRLNRLILGQRLLRAWVWPHVLSAAALLALLLAHVWQVVYFSWR